MGRRGCWKAPSSATDQIGKDRTMPDKARGMRRHLKSERTQARAYSRAVVTEGYARTIWLAGQTAVEDLDGQSLTGNFDGQVRSVFAQLARTLEEVGAKLSHMVTMTV